MTPDPTVFIAKSAMNSEEHGAENAYCLPSEETVARALNLAARAMQRQFAAGGTEEEIEAAIWRHLGRAFEAKEREIEDLKRLPVIADYIEVQEARRAAEAKLDEKEREIAATHDTYQQAAVDVVALLHEAEARAIEVEANLAQAVEALDEAIDEVESWGAYASDYFRDKHNLAGTLADLRARSAGAKFACTGVRRRVRHKKRGGVYEVLGEAQIQTSRPLEDYEVVVIYRSLNTPDIDDPASPMKGETWVRPKAEFEDGRFEEVRARSASARGET